MSENKPNELWGTRFVCRDILLVFSGKSGYMQNLLAHPFLRMVPVSRVLVGNLTGLQTG